MSMNFLPQALIGIVLLAAGIGPAVSHELTSYKRASDQFSDLAALTKSQHRMPSWSDPDAASVLKVMTDERRFLGTEKYTLEDMDALFETCEMTRRAALAYYLFDTDVAPEHRSDASKIMAIKQEVAKRNLIAYQNESFALLAFQQRCFGVSLSLMAERAKTQVSAQLSQQQREGVAQIRLGAVQGFLGAVQMVRLTDISAANRHKLFASMSLTAPHYAQTLDLRTRGEVRDYFQQLHTMLPQEFHVYLDEIGKELASSSCTGMCSL